MIKNNNKKLCEYCFAETDREPCPKCGFSREKYKRDFSVLEVGSVLEGRYVIGGVIGKGGFGITYLAYDRKLERKVAIKEYYPYGLAMRNIGSTIVSAVSEESAGTFQGGADKFYDEARLMAKFNDNPNIVSVHDFFYENETVYFTMGFLRGQTLMEYIREHGVLSSGQAVCVAGDITNALIAAHHLNVLHRDISPDNIMVCSDGTVKLLDFGAARQILEEGSQNFSVILKQGFAPPEQYQKKGKQGPWTDIYALGATLYYALTLDLLDDPMSRLDDDSEYSSNIHGIEEPLWEVIRKATMLKASERYQDIHELKAAFDGLPIMPERLTVPEEDANEMKFGMAAETEKVSDSVSSVPEASTRQKDAVVVQETIGADEVGETMPLQENAEAVEETVALQEDVAEAGQTVPLQENAEAVEETVALQEDVAEAVGETVPLHEEAGQTMLLQESAGTVEETVALQEDIADAGRTMPLQESEESVGETVALQENAVAVGETVPLQESTEAVRETMPLQESTEAVENMESSEASQEPEAQQEAELQPEEQSELKSFLLGKLRKSRVMVAGICAVILIVAAGVFFWQSFGGNSSYSDSSDNSFSFDYLESSDNSAVLAGLGYVLDSNQIIITYYEGTDTEVELPSEIDGKPVTVISESAFQDHSGLSSVIIPNSVTEIGESAFCKCRSLSSITIPDSVTEIGEYAFGGCSSLSSVIIPDSVTKIGKSVFVDCSSLSSITIPNSVTEIGEYAFGGCSSLSSITIPDSVTKIGDFAFWGCSSLRRITIPRGTEIGDFAFEECHKKLKITRKG